MKIEKKEIFFNILTPIHKWHIWMISARNVVVLSLWVGHSATYHRIEMALYLLVEENTGKNEVNHIEQNICVIITNRAQPLYGYKEMH